jgi:hypothetical protein
MPAWSGTLHFRHQRLFRHLADLWAPDVPVDAGGGGSTTYTLHTSGVPCLRDAKSAIDSPELLGLIEGEDLISVDTWRFPPGTALDSSWIVVDRTGGLNHGKGWICKGAPVREEDASSVRTTGMVEAYATRRLRLPPEILEHYG